MQASPGQGQYEPSSKLRALGILELILGAILFLMAIIGFAVYASANLQVGWASLLMGIYVMVMGCLAFHTGRNPNKNLVSHDNAPVLYVREGLMGPINGGFGKLGFHLPPWVIVKTHVTICLVLAIIACLVNWWLFVRAILMINVGSNARSMGYVGKYVDASIGIGVVTMLLAIGVFGVAILGAFISYKLRQSGQK